MLDWVEDPYARGAIAVFVPGDVGRYREALRRPHGRVHFAGEHTSALRTTVEGALRSGIRAAKEVHEAAKTVLGFILSMLLPPKRHN